MYHNTNFFAASTVDEKSAMSLIHELAQFNELSYSYELISEEVS